jgi:putative zinc finger protein
MTPIEHPSELPWYVTGKLDPHEASRVEEHVRGCAECRREVEALVSMRRTILAYRDDLALMEGLAEPGTTSGTTTGEAIGTATNAAPRRGWAPWAWALAGAAGASVVILGLLPLMRSGGMREPLLIEAPQVVLLPAQRDATGAPVLRGSGPWSIRVVLPLGAPDGEYLVRIASDDGALVDGSEIRVPDVEGGQATLLVRSLPGAGRYRITLVPVAAGGGSVAARETSYPFAVAP